MAGLSREDLIIAYVKQLAEKENMDAGRADRAWLLNTIAEVSDAVDGRRPTKPVSFGGDGGDY